MNVIIRGPLLSVTGYGCHARQVFQWAKSKGWNVQASIVPWGMCTFWIDKDAEDGLIGEIMEATSPWPPSIKADLSLQIQLPDEWDTSLAKVNIGVTAGVESDKCSEAWVEACGKMDHVIVPSNFSRSTFLQSGLNPQQISSVPESFTCGFERTSARNELDLALDHLPTDFNFLVFGQITAHNPETDRKNTFYNLKWLCEVFSGDENVGVVLKTNMGRMTVMDRRQTSMMVSRVISEVRKGPYPKIYLNHGLMDKHEIAGLFQHKKVKALVAPTRGEGWGLPILDAAVNGLPIFAPKYSGHMDFMKKVKFLDLKYREIPIPEQMCDGRIWVKGGNWIDIEEAHFKSRLKKFRKAPEMPTKWAEEAAQDVKESFRLEEVFLEYDKVMGKFIDLT